MPLPAPAREGRRMRADARHNRDRLLAAAVDVFVEVGPGVALEEISRRASTGIATLYRHFPDRHALMKAVVLDALQRTTEEALRALQEERDAFTALTRYLHRTMDIRTAAVIPHLLDVLPLDDPETLLAREHGSRALQTIVDAAHREGSLRSDVTAGDIGMLAVRMSRPMPGAFSRDLNDRLAHRHLALVIDGLRARVDDTQLQGPALTLGQLRDMTPSVDEPGARAVPQPTAGGG
jgi:AcrR family transcriptional regulator